MKQRAISLDILKILAAMMIVALHFNSYSKNLVVATATSYSLFATSNLIEAFCICGVNVFVIISCYISINAMKTDLRGGIARTFSLWAQAIFVTVPLCILLLVTGISKFSVKHVLSSFLPFSTNAYWFITTFMCFSLLLPVLNRSVKALSVSTLRYISAALVGIFCVMPTLFGQFGWGDARHGYALVWFVTLYYSTAFSVKSQWYKKLPTWVYAGVYVLFSVFLFASVLVFQRIGPLSQEADYFMRNYASIPIFIQSFALVFTFLGLNVSTQKEKLFAFLSAGSLMSYILHMHPMLKTIYASKKFRVLFPHSVLVYTLCCLAVSLLVYLLGTLLYHLLKKPIRALSDRCTALVLRILHK